jgi:hypothetical protein
MYTAWAVRGFVFILPRPPPISKDELWMRRVDGHPELTKDYR